MADRPRFTVFELTRELQKLVARFARIEVEGELASLQLPASGHAYLRLREQGRTRFEREAVLNGICFGGNWRRLDFRPREGDRVVCVGRLGIYPPRGYYQLDIVDIRPAGKGDLAREIAARIQRLRADGLLDPTRKRDLPGFPRVIGVATSTTGMALKDFLKVSRARFPGARILVAPCLVQGDAAADSVTRALDLLAADGRPEVVVVTRGGGGPQDLLPFQDEFLARAIARHPVPVVSAVGHQGDTTIADMVADHVAATPSEAAILVLPDAADLRRRVDESWELLRRAARRLLRRRQERLTALEARLRHPGERLRDVRRRAVTLEGRLVRAMERVAGDRRGRLAVARDRLPRAASAVLATRRARLEALAGRLDTLSPLAVLGRGYALVDGPRGLVRDPDEVSAGDRVEVRVARGSFAAEVVDRDQGAGSIISSRPQSTS